MSDFKKYVLSSLTTKSDFYMVLKKDEKAAIKPLIGKEVEARWDEKNLQFRMKTGIESTPEMWVPKKLMYEVK